MPLKWIKKEKQQSQPQCKPGLEKSIAGAALKTVNNLNIINN